MTGFEMVSTISKRRDAAFTAVRPRAQPRRLARRGVTDTRQPWELNDI
jgi:hypothetical protein